jgi:hypothetical protein
LIGLISDDPFKSPIHIAEPVPNHPAPFELKFSDTKNNAAEWNSVKNSGLAEVLNATLGNSTTQPSAIQVSQGPEDKEISPSDKKKRFESIAEFVLTEKNYVRDLQLVVELFIQPLTSGEQGKRIFGSLGLSAISPIFSNWKELLAVNSKFLSDLEKSQKSNEGMLTTIGMISSLHVCCGCITTRNLITHIVNCAIDASNESVSSVLCKPTEIHGSTNQVEVSESFIRCVFIRSIGRQSLQKS